MAAQERTERLSTGIGPLDRHLDGGIFPGSIVALIAPPESQSEPIIHATMRQRPSTYVTTRRDETAVESDLHRSLPPDVEYELHYAERGSQLATVARQIERLEEEQNLIVDVIDPLEDNDDATHYEELLNDLKTRLLETGSVALLHCESTEQPSENRDRTQTFADVVWDLSIEVNGTDLENRLAVPKFRGNEIVDETIKLELGQDVSVDTSRDIA
ncbi:MAG: RAD55 family ATPase [Haloferacaceae archaeon]